MKLVFTDPPIVVPPEFVQKICELKGLETKLYKTFAADEEELYNRGKDANVIIVDLTKYHDVLRRWPNLKAILTASVGTDHIDVVGY
jgi:lactate dehydrogenase-like 2-hydroxyacid dehydrogenase